MAACALVAGIVPPAAAAPGSLDVSFGVGGALRTNFGGTYDWAYATAIQPDGKILAAGVSDARGTYDFALARYTSAHALDPSFGINGVVLTDFGHSYDWAYALALQPDGGILVAGVSDVSGSKDFAIARYGPNGSLDRSFGRDGLMTERMRPFTADIVRGMALQPDGKIVVVGVTYEDVLTTRPHGDFMVARYLPDGSNDLSFGIGGVTTTDFS
ncbi:MAG TPA: delta-60 repeat domain-containing protein, partial [Acidimicrobiia bacterium]|nr:delta-60 repeat domain-containing protein [Acidimicrobiia bacterium]